MGDPKSKGVETVDLQFDALRKRRQPTIGLRTQILFVLSAVLLVTILLIGLAVLHIGERNLVQERAQGGVSVAQVLARTISAGLVSGKPLDHDLNKDHLLRAATTNAEFRGISQIVIVSNDMEILVAVPATENRDETLSPGVEHAVVMGERRPLWSILTHEGRRELFVLAPMEEAEVVVGAIGLRIPIDDVDNTISASRRLMLLYIALDALILLFIGYLLLTRLIVRPIEVIAHGTRQVMRGNYTQTLKTGTSNEIGRLAEDFNAMLRELQSQRAALQDQLGRLKETNETLARTQKSLFRSEKLATVGRLAAGVAHEIGNPLSAVLGYVELLKEGDLDDPTRADLIVRVERELHRIDRTVRELLDYSRAEGDEITLCDLNNCISGALYLVEAQPRFRNIDLVFEAGGDLPPIPLNEGRMQQVIVNLLLNAADAIEGDGVISIGSRSGEGCVKLSVEDSGEGIDPQHLAQIFEPFFTTKDSGAGTGLGLAICQSIIASFDGEIEVRNAQGGGALFEVTLPTTSTRH